MSWKSYNLLPTPIIPLFSLSVKSREGQKNGAVRGFSGMFDQKRLEGPVQYAVWGLEIGDKTVNFYRVAPKFGLTGAGKGV